MLRHPHAAVRPFGRIAVRRTKPASTARPSHAASYVARGSGAGARRPPLPRRPPGHALRAAADPAESGRIEGRRSRGRGSGKRTAPHGPQSRRGAAAGPFYCVEVELREGTDAAALREFAALLSKAVPVTKETKSRLERALEAAGIPFHGIKIALRNIYQA